MGVAEIADLALPRTPVPPPPSKEVGRLYVLMDHPHAVELAQANGCMMGGSQPREAVREVGHIDKVIRITVGEF